MLIVVEDGGVLHDFDDQPSTVTAVAWSPDGTRVGAAAYGGVDWHDVVGPRSGRSRRFDWRGALLALVLSPDGKWACAGAQDSTVHLWKLWSGQKLSPATAVESDVSTSRLQWVSDDDLLIGRADGGVVKLAI